MRIPMLVWACVALLAIQAKSFALTFSMDIDDLNKGAFQVIEAEVVETNSLWSSFSAMIVTEITLRVDKRYKGVGENELTIRLPGGSLGGQVLHFNVNPNFKQGEQLILFLDENEGSEFDTIHGGVSGKYLLEEDQIKDQALKKHLEQLNDVSLGDDRLLSKQAHGHEWNDADHIHRNCGCSKMPVHEGQRSKAKFYSASLPVAINPMSSTKSLAGRGLAMIAEWNQYGELFAPLAEAQPSQWNNGVCDIVGFAEEEVIKEKFGITWGRTLGFTVSRTNELGEILEADIYLNPNVNWAKGNEEIPFKEGVYGVDLTIMHELGHVLGLDDNFEELSVMNYAPRRFDGEYALKASDVKDLREIYPQTPVLNDDVGLYMYSSTGYQSYSDAICRVNGVKKGNIEKGDTISIEDFTLESCGGQMALEMDIQWKLTPNYQSLDGAFDLGLTQAVALPGESMMWNAKMLVPDDTPAGTYYLAALINSPYDQVSINNAAWLRQPFSLAKSDFDTKVEPHPLVQGSASSGGGGGCLMR